MARYRLFSQDSEINVGRRVLRAGDDGVFDVVDGGADEAALLSAGAVPAVGLTAQQAAEQQAVVSDAGKPFDYLSPPLQHLTLNGAMSASVALAATATGTYRKCRVAWNNNGASPGSVAVTPTGSPFSYTAPSDGTLAVAGGTVSGITIARRGSSAVSAGLTAGMVPVLAGDVVAVTYSAAPTLTFLPAGMATLRIAVNADNDTHGLLITQNAKRRDHEMAMGDAVILVCAEPITRLHFSADVAINSGLHSLVVTFGN